jgi:hypothetical protein
MTLAPILLSVYTREEHFKRCVKSLSECRLANKSTLYIVSDGGKTEKDQIIIDRIRDYISEIRGFKELILIARDKNLGVDESIGSIFFEILNKHGKIIFTEDDNIFSPNFLEYLNNGLEFYKNDYNITSISGYKHNFKLPSDYKRDIFVWYCFAAWGCATWKDHIDFFHIYDDIEKVMYDKQKLRKIKLAYGESIPFVMGNFIFKKVYKYPFLDNAISYYNMINEKYTIFPVISKVRNIGWDGTGQHCIKDASFLFLPMDDGNSNITFEKNLKVDKEINRRLRNYTIRQLHRNMYKRFLIQILDSILPINLYYNLHSLYKRIKSCIRILLYGFGN